MFNETTLLQGQLRALQRTYMQQALNCSKDMMYMFLWFADECSCCLHLPTHAFNKSAHGVCAMNEHCCVCWCVILYSWHWQQTSVYHPIESSRNVMNPHLAPEGWLCCICKSVSSFCLSVNSHDDVDYCTNFFCIFYTFYSIHHVDRDTCVTAS